ncbi:MAG: arabinofuranosidase catalytic domain-containing protein [Acidobacteriota bacterium]
MQLRYTPCFAEFRWFRQVLLAVAICQVGVTAAHAFTRRPCDIFAPQTPCVAAYSTVRALYHGYRGPLYQVMRQSDQASINIGLLRDGYADASRQDAFCAHTSCTIVKIYDQSPKHNDLIPAPPGGAAHGPGPNGYDVPAKADALPITVHGHPVYGVAVNPGVGYRDDAPVGTAIDGQPEGVYMVTSALHLNSRCCFDLGNAEINNLDNDAGHMDAINIMCKGSPCKPVAGLDMENGIYGRLPVAAGTSFVTDMGANDGQHSYAIYQGNAQSGGLTTTGVIPLPKRYQPMKQEGAIILGTGGDNSNWASGYFFEGVMTAGMPSADTLKAVQRNIVDARYTGHLKR